PCKRRNFQPRFWTGTINNVARVRCRQPRIGARKLHYLLNTQADKRLNIGRDRLFNLLDEYRLLCRNYDLILTMEKRHIERLCEMAPEMRGKVMLFGHW
ncbi:hypothetical protein NE615_27405, partial [Escherichia coli]|uniref:arsenate reductase/protein-tyrosine-phosphatase family protein n=1 Tax=Escherichia coli TaxID=562 RepID=UPI004046C77E|nr:hypothetical protein [Escherichia coli]